MQSDLTDQQLVLVQERPNLIDYNDLDQLYYLGNYSRNIGVSLTRMMENAYDWEHLPFVHSSSFSSIDCLDNGAWGWRAKLGVPKGDYQLLDLRVDKDNYYWVSTVFFGFGAGIEIHTQAREIDKNNINVDVRFYLPKKPNMVMGPIILAYMKKQYKRLYDEDEELMLGRQKALDINKVKTNAPDRWSARLSDLDETITYPITLSSGRFVLRHHRGDWMVHSALCPHMLGPLDGEVVDDGIITCPWHGYQFDAQTGVSLQPHCASLRKAPRLEINGDTIYLIG